MEHARDQTADLRKLALELSMAEVRERRRIAEDLHDHLGQYLALIQMKLSTFQGNTMFCGQEQELVEIQNLLNKAIQFTRHLTMAVSPTMLYDLGLIPTLRWLAEQYERQYQLPITVTAKKGIPELQPDIRGVLYRSIRELLLNVIKHAGAGHAGLNISFERGLIVITLTDDGDGFDPDALDHENAFGLFSIRERMMYLGGSLDLESAPGKGTTVTIRCPVMEDAAG
ncbi:MAG TPA: sensor histidine kinase [bacterium]|nr:sensor histidine kinase [bacterium]